MSEVSLRGFFKTLFSQTLLRCTDNIAAFSLLIMVSANFQKEREDRELFLGEGTWRKNRAREIAFVFPS